MVKIKKISEKLNYLLSDSGHWIKDFTSEAKNKDINNLYSVRDMQQAVQNETNNKFLNLPDISREKNFVSDIAIISDGYDLANESVRELINNLGKNKIRAIGVNGVLRQGVKPSYFFVNDPSSQVMNYFPQRVVTLPTLIASARTNTEFLKKYKSRGAAIFTYVPTPTKKFCSKLFQSTWNLDDYRNPICGTMNLVYRWGAVRILLIAPHDLFAEERPGTEKVGDLYLYPQQRIAHNFIDGMAYWLKKSEIEVYNISSGPKFKNIDTISVQDANKIFCKGTS